MTPHNGQEDGSRHQRALSAALISHQPTTMTRDILAEWGSHVTPSRRVMTPLGIVIAELSPGTTPRGGAPQ